MIVKKHGFKLSQSTLYGFAGGAFALVTVGFMISSQMAPETYASCSERYADAGMLAFDNASGSVLRPAELQSKLAGKEWGVLQNVAIKPNETDTSQAAMTIDFKAGGTANFARREAASGVGFKWQPAFLKRASAACLSYSVHLPKDFRFANGGTMPGLYGQSKPAADDGKEAFSMRMRWLEGGKAGVQPVTAKKRKGQLFVLADQWLQLPRDRWVEVEQEVVLNTPGQQDGALRIWLDGQLHLNMEGLAWRKQPTTGFVGVIADTHYANRNMEWAPAPRATKIKLSPMIVRWQ